VVAAVADIKSVQQLWVLKVKDTLAEKERLVSKTIVQVAVAEPAALEEIGNLVWDAAAKAAQELHLVLKDRLYFMQAVAVVVRILVIPAEVLAALAVVAAVAQIQLPAAQEGQAVLMAEMVTETTSVLLQVLYLLAATVERTPEAVAAESATKQHYLVLAALEL
jgi:cation transporter-like permease